tara:strand:+ start:26 stop:1993 length:1968 start_codon:yes stop_codon:yes gene_type:complete
MNKEEIINQAFKYHSKGKISEAERYYQIFLEKGFSDARVYLNLGQIFKNKGQINKAEIYTRKAIALNSEYADAYSNLGGILMKIGKLKDAEIYTRKAITLKPDSGLSYSILGNILSLLGKLNESEKYLRKAIQLNPNYPNPYCNLGGVLRNIGDSEEAEFFTRKAIQLNPGYATAHYNLGIILEGFGKLKEAKQSFYKAIELKPEHAESYSHLGKLFERLNESKRAEEFFRSAIKLNPNLAEANSNLGAILYKSGKSKEAESFSLKAVKINPFYAIAFYNLGVIQQDLGKLKDSKIAYLEAIKLDPKHAKSYTNLGSLLLKIGELEEAEFYTREAIKIDPDYALAHINLGFILMDLGKLEQLIQCSNVRLNSKSINLGDKLQSTLKITIANLLQRDFETTLINIKKIKNFLNQGAIEEISNIKNKKHTSTFCKFITELYPLLNKKNSGYNSLTRIPHIGESHCLSFAHQTFPLRSNIQNIQPVLITGGKAWHFAKNDNNRWKDSLIKQIKNHTYSDSILISFGEIDCRKDEGILAYSIKNNKQIADVCEITINGYLKFMEKALSSYYSNRYYFGVPAPTKQAESLDDLEICRIKMIKTFNCLLKAKVLSKGCYFLDVYGLTSTIEGLNSNDYMVDETHLSPKCLSILFKNYLCEP